MKYLKKSLLALTVLSSVAILSPARQTQAAFYPSGAYIKMADYYVHPGDPVQVLGYGFMPGEIASINLFGQNYPAWVGDDGKFYSMIINVPFASIKSMQYAVATGATSKIKRSARFTVGGYYPVVEPSKWYLLPGYTVSFSGRGFAPNEPVRVWNGGQNVATVQADNVGNIITPDFTAPASPGPWQFGFEGTNSRATYAVNLSIGLWP